MIGTATILYLLGCVAAYAIHTPVGSNAARLGELVAGPVVALLLVPRRAWLLLALAAVPLTYLQVDDALTDLEHGSQASTAAYYRPLIGFLGAATGDLASGGSVHARALGELLAGAAGAAGARVGAAERHRRQPLFYDGRLTAASYDAWLHRLAVRYVAVARRARRTTPRAPSCD